MRAMVRAMVDNTVSVICVSVKTLLNLFWVDYEAAVEIRVFPLWKARRGTKPRAACMWAEPDTAAC